MTESVLIADRAGGVLKLTINRPDKLNALNREVMTALGSAFEQAAADDSVRCITLTGAGDRAFIAGADIAELRELDSEGARKNARFAHQLMALMEGMGKPIIAAINGFALGGGCELALACTIRIASSRAKIGLPEIKLGLLPGYGGTQRLARLAGRGRALDMMLSGEPIDAARAFEWGIVSRVVEPDQLTDAVAALANQLAHSAPLAVAAIIEAVQRGADLRLQDGLDIEESLFGAIFGSEDMREGTGAFLEKRKAEFKGR